MKFSLPKDINDNLTEHQIQYTIMGYLRMNGYYVERLNSGKFSAGQGRSQRFIMGVSAGTPDLMAFKTKTIAKKKYVGLFFIEVKRPGKKPTFLQEEKMKELESYGAKCVVASSIEDLEAAGL